MRSFIKSHKRIGSFGKDDPKYNSKKLGTLSSSPSNENDDEVPKTFELISTNNPNITAPFKESPLNSPRSPMSPSAFRSSDLPMSLLHQSPKFGNDEFSISMPSSPKSNKVHSFGSESNGSNSKKKLLKYPKNLFNGSSGSLNGPSDVSPGFAQAAFKINTNHNLGENTESNDDEFYFGTVSSFDAGEINPHLVGLNSQLVPERKSPFLTKEEWERKLKVPSKTLFPEGNNHVVRDHNHIYEQARTESLLKLTGLRPKPAKKLGSPDKDTDGLQNIRKSSYSNFNEPLIINVAIESPLSSKTTSPVREKNTPDSKRGSNDSGKSKRDSFKNVIDKVKHYKRKSGNSEKSRVSVASINNTRVSVLHINADKRASILKKLRKHDTINKKVSIREPNNTVVEFEELDDASDLSSSNASAFSFERDLINGRNASIKYYKSDIDQMNELGQNDLTIYLDDFNADEYGEEDFDEDVNFYDENEDEDDTEHLFNRKLWSDDEQIDDDAYEDLVDEINQEVHENDKNDKLNDDTSHDDIKNDDDNDEDDNDYDDLINDVNQDYDVDEELEVNAEHQPLFFDQDVRQSPKQSLAEFKSLDSEKFVKLPLAEKSAQQHKSERPNPYIATAQDKISSIGADKNHEKQEETFVGNRYSWVNGEKVKMPVESYYEGDTINDYFNADDYLDEVNFVPEDFEFEPDVSFHIYDSHTNKVFTPDSDHSQNRMYRSNSYSKKPKPGPLNVSEVPSGSTFTKTGNGKKVTLFNGTTTGSQCQQTVPDSQTLSAPESKDLSRSNSTDLLSPITESFGDDILTSK